MMGLTISNVLVAPTLIIASGLSLASLLAVERVYRTLSPGIIRATWGVLALLICILALGDLVLLGNYMQGPNDPQDLLVAAFCLAASLFIVLACRLAQHSANDISRLSRLESVACVDPVTELYNRRHIMDVLDTECIRSCTHNSPLSILLMDVDNFKKINDAYGHQAGDVVLREMGVLITAA